MKPLCIDGFCGLGGWSEGFLAEGWDVIGFDIEEHVYGRHRYPGQLCLQDMRTLHGSQFRSADCLVMSPPCQKYSYMAMPWTRSKELARWYRDPEHPERITELNDLFYTCFRLQREASEAAGRHIPMIVENVRGAQPWVGRSRWAFGSFHLWGDVPALMPPVLAGRMKSRVSCSPRRFEDRIAGTSEEAHAFHHKLPGFRFDGSGRSFQSASVEGVKVASEVGRRTDIGNGARFTSRDCGVEGVKQGGDWFAEARKGGAGGTSASFGSKSSARKQASAMIAKIPLPLSRYIAQVYCPVDSLR